MKRASTPAERGLAEATSGRAWRLIETPDGSEAIDALWQLEVRADVEHAVSCLVLPDGCMDLLVRYRLEGERMTAPTLLVVGPADSETSVEMRAADGFVGLRFKPGWGGACLGVSASEFYQCTASASEVSRELRALHERLSHCERPEQLSRLLRLVAGEWTARRAPHRRAVEAVRLLRSSDGQLDIAELARRVDLSPRALRREVGAVVGLPPKTLARVFRFRRALQLRRDRPTQGLAELAAGCGYADQAHMTREFRELGGLTPSAVGADQYTSEHGLAVPFKTRWGT